MALNPLISTLATAMLGKLIQLVFSHMKKRVDAKRLDRAYKDSAPTPDTEAPAPAVFQTPPGAVPTERISSVTSAALVERRQAVQELLLDAELTEAQAALRRIRKSLDDAVHENAQSRAEVVILREANAELKEELRKRDEQVARLQAELDVRRRMPIYDTRHTTNARDDGERPFDRGPSTGRLRAPPPVPPPRAGRKD